MVNRIKKRIKEEIDNNIITSSDSISQNVDWARISTVHKIDSADKQHSRKLILSNKSQKSIYAVVLAFISLVVVVLACILPYISNQGYYSQQLSYSVTLSINPNIQFNVNKDDIIVSQKPLNTDGVKLLFNSDYVGTSIDSAMSQVVEMADKYGYITDTSVIGINVKGSDKIKRNKTNSVMSILERYLIKSHPHANLSELTESDVEQLINSCDDETIKTYTQSLKQQYRVKLHEAIDNKITDSDTLLSVLAVAQYPQDKETVESAISDYDDQYIFDDYGVINSQADIERAIDELSEIIEELEALRDKLNNDEPIDDHQDVLEDIIELVDKRIKGKGNNGQNNDDDTGNKGKKHKTIIMNWPQMTV
ncbi:MAG: hypothetical protein PHW00_06210 [Clostridia bacterium]|nr:hypothetical protein [Clostridia bacterium]